MKRILFPLFVLLAVTSAAWGQQMSFSATPIGVEFLEAPPGRDKNLAPMGSNNLEKVEAQVVLSVKNGLIVDSPFTVRESKVKALAVFPDRSTVDLGSVEVSSFGRMNAERTATLVSVRLQRLPDKRVSAVAFWGSINLRVAKRLVAKTSAFEAKAGSRVDFGGESATVAKFGASAFTLKGGAMLLQIAELKLLRNDGTVIKAERRGYSQLGNSVETEWSFSSPLAGGKLEAMLYEGVETAEIPINITISRPF